MNRDKLKNSVIKTLLYYDLFNYPLKVEEVYSFLGTNSITPQDVLTTLHTLVGQRQVFQHGDFFSLQNDEANIIRRVKGNQCAERHADLAYKQARLISRFPFVRGVMASGSFSKGYMDEKSDLDFFIVTSPGRLWIARTLIVMFKRIFYFNSHKYFCCNYFIDTNHLEIEEKNLFTATELATLVPLYGANVYENLIADNPWILGFFPNYKRRSTEGLKDKEPGWIKTWLEKILKRGFGDKLDRYFMNTTLQRWKKIYEDKYSSKDFDNAFKTRKYVSKNHPRHYQRNVIRRYEEKLKWFSEKYKVKMEPIAER